MSDPGAVAPAAAYADRQAFEPQPARPRVLLLGEDAGTGVVVELALRLADRRELPWRPLVLLGTSGPFEFRPRPSTLLVPGMPAGVIACLPQLDAASVPSRLASAADLPGCFAGTVVELADLWLAALDRKEFAQTGIWSSGPAPLVAAAEALAARWGLPYLARAGPAAGLGPGPAPQPGLSRS